MPILSEGGVMDGSLAFFWSTQMPDNFWVQVLTDKGLAIVILAAVAGAFWRLGRFLAPHVATIVQSHSALVITLQETSVKQTILLEALKEEHNEHNTKMDDILGQIGSQKCQYPQQK